MANEDDVPTATALLKKEIDRFLGSDEPEVLCIRGRWGVGKTYAWNKYIKDANDKPNGIALSKYSYVTLFGLKSLEEIKYAIFENQVASKDVGAEPSIENLQANTTAVLNRGWRFAASKVVNTFWKSGADALQVLSFLSVTKQIVVLDDLERKGKDLRTQDVLGLIALLRDQKKCKVVLIMNDEALDEEKEQEALQRYQEKVIDSSLLFAPTEEECVAIALDQDFPGKHHLREFCVSLGISNIRVIKKIERLVRHVHPLLKDFNEEVFRLAVQTLALFGWAHYSRIESDGTSLIQFCVEKRGQGLYGGTRQKELKETEQRWDKMLDDYKWRVVDELDLALLDGIKAGFFDEDLVRRQGEKINERVLHLSMDQTMEAAWGKFHDSFEDNEPEATGAIIEALRANVSRVSPATLSGTLSYLKEMGHPEEAKVTLDFYMEQRSNESKEFFNLDDYTFREDIDDEDVKAAFAAKFASIETPFDPVESITRISREHSWNPRDVAKLVELGVDGLEKMFRGLSGRQLREAADTISDFRKLAAGNNEIEKRLAGLGAEALYRIADDSPINKRRVRRKGFVRPTEEARDD
jgi:hypothetical protein